MAWCFSTRASVATVLTTHPCGSRCLRVKEWTQITLWTYRTTLKNKIQTSAVWLVIFSVYFLYLLSSYIFFISYFVYKILGWFCCLSCYLEFVIHSHCRGAYHCSSNRTANVLAGHWAQVHWNEGRAGVLQAAMHLDGRRGSGPGSAAPLAADWSPPAPLQRPH